MKAILICTALLVLLSGCGGRPTDDHASRDANHAHPSNGNGTVDHNSMDHGSNRDTASHQSMDHSGMTSSPGAAEAPIELQFLDTMIAHHKGAVEMATLAETKAQSPELKELAAGMIADQEREIGKMSEWREGWFEGKPKAINMEFPGMSHGMNGMDMKKLESLNGRDFDVEFLRQMIPHHEGALEMAKAVTAKGGRPEIKQLAEDITSAQESEIKQMRKWLADWSK